MGKECCKDGKEECGCGHDHGNVSVEEIVYNNNVVLNTLINLLIEKKVITEKELMEKLNELEGEEGKEE